MAASGKSTASPDARAVDVALAAELTGLSQNAIRARIRRRRLESDLRDGRHRIPIAELQRLDLLVAGDRYRSLRQRVESLEAEVEALSEARNRVEAELRESEARARMLWGIARDRAVKAERARRWVRLPWRRGAG
jgi:chromosome segregation ATPase